MNKLIVAACLAVSTNAVFAEPMVKAGLWEIRVEKQIIDGRDLSGVIAAAQTEMQKMMANMSPEQRKQLEKAAGGRSLAGMGAGASPNAYRICISPEMAAQDKPVAPGNSKCDPAKHQRIGNRIVFELNCPGVVGKGESILSGDTVSTTMDMTITDAGGKHVMHTESRMNYLGADCKGIKPMEQLAREMQNPPKK